MTRVSGFVCKDCGKPFSMEKSEIEFYENKGLEQPKRCPECRKKRRSSRPKGCICATFEPDSARYKCSVSGDGCMYMIPDSKRCAEEYGEGPDAQHEPT